MMLCCGTRSHFSSLLQALNKLACFLSSLYDMPQAEKRRPLRIILSPRDKILSENLIESILSYFVSI